MHQLKGYQTQVHSNLAPLTAGRLLVLGEWRHRQQPLPRYVPVIPRRTGARSQNWLAAHTPAHCGLLGSVIPQLQRPAHCREDCCCHDWIHSSALPGPHVSGFATHQARQLGSGGPEDREVG